MSDRWICDGGKKALTMVASAGVSMALKQEASRNQMVKQSERLSRNSRTEQESLFKVDTPCGDFSKQKSVGVIFQSRHIFRRFFKVDIT